MEFTFTVQVKEWRRKLETHNLYEARRQATKLGAARLWVLNPLSGRAFEVPLN